MFFLILLTRAKVLACEIFSLYHTCIRLVLEYCATLYHHTLPTSLSDDLERIQKHALSIISPSLVSVDNLTLHNMSCLKDRCTEQCNKLFDFVVCDSAHKLHHLLPPKNV